MRLQISAKPCPGAAREHGDIIGAGTGCAVLQCVVLPEGQALLDADSRCCSSTAPRQRAPAVREL